MFITFLDISLQLRKYLIAVNSAIYPSIRTSTAYKWFAAEEIHVT